MAVRAIILLGLAAFMLPARICADGAATLPSRKAGVVIPLLEKLPANVDIHEVQKILGKPDGPGVYALDDKSTVYVLLGQGDDVVVIQVDGPDADTLYKKSEPPEERVIRLRMDEKLRSIVIDKFNFESHDLNSKSMMEYLTRRSKELDPEHIGIKFITLKPSPPYKAKGHDFESWTDLPLSEIVRYISGAENLDFRFEGNTVVFFRPPSSSQKSN